MDPDARLIERCRTGDDRPEIIDAALGWRPQGASAPFVLDVERFFGEMYDTQ